MQEIQIASSDEVVDSTPAVTEEEQRALQKAQEEHGRLLAEARAAKAKAEEEHQTAQQKLQGAEAHVQKMIELATPFRVNSEAGGEIDAVTALVLLEGQLKHMEDEGRRFEEALKKFGVEFDTKSTKWMAAHVSDGAEEDVERRVGFLLCDSLGDAIAQRQVFLSNAASKALGEEKDALDGDLQALMRITGAQQDAHDKSFKIFWGEGDEKTAYDSVARLMDTELNALRGQIAGLESQQPKSSVLGTLMKVGGGLMFGGLMALEASTRK